MKTFSKVLNKEFDFEVNHLGLIISKEWINDKYIVFIEGEEFEYSQGIGHREALNSFKKEEFNKIMRKNPAKNKQNLLMYAKELKAVSKTKPLNIDDVLYSLILDAQSGSELFEDFCSNLGYDEDSRTAKNIYDQCQNNAKKVRTFISNLDEASEMFQDY